MARRRGAGPRTGRGLKTRLKTAKGRPAGSSRWLQRQLSDPYVAAARAAGYRSRAAYKLIELDDRFHILAPGRRVVDLGAAPGGWTQVAVERVKPGPRGGRVVALDLAEMEPVTGAAAVIGDLREEETRRRAREALGGPADVVLSDASPAATGHASTDHLRIVALAEAALDFAEAALAPEGMFVAKVFQGGAERELLLRLKRLFRRVRHAKPPASRKESAEVYVVAEGFRGAKPE